jgi:hypothetical protein
VPNYGPFSLREKDTTAGKQEAKAEDEGIYKTETHLFLITLTPTLSLRERELTGQQ